MEPPIFYVPSESCQSDRIILPREEAHHAKTVLRLKENSQVIVVDGKGVGYRGIITNVRGRKDTVVVVQTMLRSFGEPVVKVTLAAGLSTGFKFDSIVEKGTELGVSRFVPLLTEKSKVKPADAGKASTKERRFRRVALSAMKQCRRSRCPEILPAADFEKFVQTPTEQSLNLIFHPSESRRSLKSTEDFRDHKEVIILVGPESGFTIKEVDLAVAAGYQSVSLGQRILRTENAAPVACALVMHWLGELN